MNGPPTRGVWMGKCTTYTTKLHIIDGISTTQLRLPIWHDIRSQCSPGAVYSCLRHLRPFLLYLSKIIYVGRGGITLLGSNFKGHCHGINLFGYQLNDTFMICYLSFLPLKSVIVVGMIGLSSSKRLPFQKLYISIPSIDLKR